MKPITFTTIHPLLMEFYDGSFIEETYDGMGNHLTTDYHEANTIHIIIHDKEYTGTGHIYEKGKIKIERTPGGYFDYSTKSFRHYLTDYQGNNIAVADNDGIILEQTDYYPYGEPWREPDHPYTYSDNERLHTFGQNQYDFHARRLVATLLRFDKPDPLMEQYPWLNPYTYCAANPIMLTDPNGLNPVYNLRGEYLGNTAEGFTGMILIYNGDENIDFSKMTVNALYDQLGETIHQLEEIKNQPIDGVQIGGEALSNIWTHLISVYEDKLVNDKLFSMATITGGKIQYDSASDDSSDASWYTHMVNNTISGCKNHGYESTVENITASLLYHEWYGHLISRYCDNSGNHRKAYESVINSPLWENTTEKYKETILSNLQFYLKKELGIDSPEYKKLYNKYFTNSK